MATLLSPLPRLLTKSVSRSQKGMGEKETERKKNEKRAIIAVLSGRAAYGIEGKFA